jgi:uncharacterized protein (TIGR02679 family)
MATSAISSACDVAAALDRPSLARMWDLVAARLQRNGLRPAGTVRLDGLRRDERHAIAGLLGRPVAGARVSVDLAELDRRIRASGAAGGVIAVAERLRGPLVDRAGARRARADAAARVWAAGREALARAGLSSAPWVERWLDDVHRSGSLGRVDGDRAERVIVQVVRCVGALPRVAGGPLRGRSDLSSLATGDAHGLDDGHLVTALVLRAAAAVVGCGYPTTTAGRRALWREVGVITDEVSATALTMGLRSDGTWLDGRTDAGWESHLTARDLRRIEVRPPLDGVVHVCENPRVLEAAIDAGVGAAIVCTMGQPAGVVTALLRSLVGDGAELRYHGDFDWPGIAIANAVFALGGCRPWRFAVDDYLDVLARLVPMVGDLPQLGDAPVTASWDIALTDEMKRARRAIHEELVLDELLSDLAGR